MASYSLKFLIQLLIYNGLGKISSIVDVPNSTFNNNNTSNNSGLSAFRYNILIQKKSRGQGGTSFGSVVAETDLKVL